MLPIQVATGAKLGAAAAFVIGILAALGAGLWSLYVFKRVSPAAGTMLAHWLTVADDGERLKALEATMKADGRTSKSRGPSDVAHCSPARRAGRRRISAVLGKRDGPDHRGAQGATCRR
jgi:hypothetical protein